MGRNISLFSNYSQSENRTTNYCLLMLKLLYEENPKFLAEFLNNIGGENLSKNVGVKFIQQSKKLSSVPDGVIKQGSFSIFIEVKESDWFYDDQMLRHLKSLEKENGEVKILLALSNYQEDNYKTKFERLYKDKSKSMVIEVISFEELIHSIENIDGLPKNLKDFTFEFKEYLNERNLLPTWKNWMDVINCATLPDDVTKGNVYMCPATGGSYSHSRCKYFGMYRNKIVERVALIEAVIDIESPNDKNLKWKNIEADENELKDRAFAVLNNIRPDEYPTKVFLLGQLFETNFIKHSKGGMQGSKQYFDISQLKINDSKELSQKLQGRTWDDLWNSKIK